MREERQDKYQILRHLSIDETMNIFLMTLTTTSIVCRNTFDTMLWAKLVILTLINKFELHESCTHLREKLSIVKTHSMVTTKETQKQSSSMFS